MPKRNFFKRSAQKRYKSQQFKNPYFREEKKFPWKLLFVLLGILGITIFCLWFFLASDYFELKTIEVEGCEVIDTQELTGQVAEYLEQSTLFLFTKRNRFLFSSDELRKLLEQTYSFEMLAIEIKQNKLFVDVKERASTFVWNTDQSWLLFDLNGVLVRYLTTEELAWLQDPTIREGPLRVDENGNEIEVTQEESMTPEEIFHTYPIIKDLNEIEVEIGDKVLEPEEIDLIVEFIQRVTSLGIEIQETQIDRLAGKWTGLLTTEGFLILFDTDGNIDEQVVHLSTLLQESIDESKVLEYIDVRFGDHLYFKYQE
jgi:hypothetical protein